MSIEYRDGSFSPNLPISDAFEKFWTEIEEGIPIRSLHVGSEKELDEVREKANIQTQLDELSAKVDSIEKPKSDFVHFPTQEEIKQLG